MSAPKHADFLTYGSPGVGIVVHAQGHMTAASNYLIFGPPLTATMPEHPPAELRVSGLFGMGLAFRLTPAAPVADMFFITGGPAFGAAENVMSMLQQKPVASAEQLRLAREALGRLQARKHESIDAWADKLAADLGGFKD